MPDNIYGIVSGIMKYVFILLGAVIVLRAYSMLIREKRDTKRRLRNLPDAGTVGELLVIHGCEGLPEGTSLPVPREGVLGFLRSCDLSVYGPGIKKRHLNISFENGLGLLVTPRSGCSALVDGIEFNCRTDAAKHPMIHGSYLQVGEVVLRLRLFACVDINRNARYSDFPESAEPLPAATAPAGDWSDAYAVQSSASDHYEITGTASPVYGNIQDRSLYAPVSPDNDRFAVPEPVSGNTSPRRRRRSDTWEDNWDE